MEKHYLVHWEIDAFAKSPEEAARQAFEAMQKPTWATLFKVLDLNSKK